MKIKFGNGVTLEVHLPQKHGELELRLIHESTGATTYVHHQRMRSISDGSVWEMPGYMITRTRDP